MNWSAWGFEGGFQQGWEAVEGRAPGWSTWGADSHILGRELPWRTSTNKKWRIKKKIRCATGIN